MTARWEGGSASATRSFDPSRSGIESAILTATGGARSFPTQGSIGPGRMIITLEPIEGGGT